jgi:hypothetical protein
MDRVRPISFGVVAVLSRLRLHYLDLDRDRC